MAASVFILDYAARTNVFMRPSRSNAMCGRLIFHPRAVLFSDSDNRFTCIRRVHSRWALPSPTMAIMRPAAPRPATTHTPANCVPSRIPVFPHWSLCRRIHANARGRASANCGPHGLAGVRGASRCTWTRALIFLRAREKLSVSHFPLHTPQYVSCASSAVQKTPRVAWV